MFGVGWTELAVLMVVGLFVFGPERLPRVVADVARVLRQLRQMAQGVTDDLKAELGPEVAQLDLASLNPRTFVSRHLLGDEPVPATAAAGWPGSGRTLMAGEIPPYDSDAT
ncbi:MAG: sec-independent translocase [Mycobacteriales bacterium]